MDKFIELDEAAGQTKFVKLDKFIALDGAKKLRPQKKKKKSNYSEQLGNSEKNRAHVIFIHTMLAPKGRKRGRGVMEKWGETSKYKQAFRIKIWKG